MNASSWRLEVERGGPLSLYHQLSSFDQSLINEYLSTQALVFPATTVTLQILESEFRVLTSELTNPFTLAYEEGALLRRAQQGAETLCRVTGASKSQPLSILDATAGLGREAFLMSSCGANVTAVERSLPLYLLMRLALRQTSLPLELKLGRAQELYPANFDVIYLDPMFPARTKKAAVGREAVILKSFAPPPTPEEERELLTWALDHAQYRVVVKRPMKAPPLVGPAPTSAVKGRAIRFDLYGLKRLPRGSS